MSDFLSNDKLVLVSIGIIFIFILFILIKSYFKKPFKMPKIEHDFDISGKRQPSYEELIDEWIIDLYKQNKSITDVYNACIGQWEVDCQKIIKRSILWKKHRKNIYNFLINQVNGNDYMIFTFTYSRRSGIENTLQKSIQQMWAIDNELHNINYRTTREKYNETNQRKLVTGQIRQDIKRRDNYTCQICGISKQFLDDLCQGLGDYLLFEIDHIQSVSQQGLSTEDNLQCLCWRCNRAKSGTKSNEEVKKNLTYGIDKLRARRRR